MQRVEVIFSDKEYQALEDWFSAKRTRIRKIIKRFDILNKGEVEEVRLIFKEKDGKLELEIDNHYSIFMKGLVFLRFYNLESLLGVFRLNQIGNEDEILIKFDKEFKKNGYFSSESNYKVSKINILKVFIYQGNEYLKNTISYADFSNIEDIVVSIYSYVLWKEFFYLNVNEEVEEIEELVALKLDTFGYERNTKGKKDKTDIRKKFVVKIKKCENKEEEKKLILSTLIDLFYEASTSSKKIESAIVDFAHYLALYYMKC